MRDQIERVLELAPRSHHVIEQLHVLDRARELPPELVRTIEEVELSARLDADAFEHDRAERAPRPAKRNGQHRGDILEVLGRIARRRHDFGAHAAHRGGGGRRRIVGVHARPARDVL